MSPSNQSDYTDPGGGPRASGDEPYVHYTAAKLNKWSPRERG